MRSRNSRPLTVETAPSPRESFQPPEMQRDCTADIVTVIVTDHIHGACFIAVFAQQGGIRMSDRRMAHGPRFCIKNNGPALFFQIRVYLTYRFSDWVLESKPEPSDPGQVWLRLALSQLGSRLRGRGVHEVPFEAPGQTEYPLAAISLCRLALSMSQICLKHRRTKKRTLPHPLTAKRFSNLLL